MPDQAKIIKGLEWCIRTTKAGECKFALVDCPYVEECKAVGSTSLLKDCLEYMKQQEPIEPQHLKAGDFCGNCNSFIRWSDKYCPECGRNVKR